MPRSRSTNEIAEAIRDQVGGGWFFTKDLDPHDSFYHGMMGALKGANLAHSRRVDDIDGVKQWRLTERALKRLDLKK